MKLNPFYLFGFVSVVSLSACDLNYDSAQTNTTPSVSAPIEQNRQLSDSRLAGRGNQVVLNTKADLQLAPSGEETSDHLFTATFKADFPNAKKVSIAGEMNNWTPNVTPLSKTATGVWQVRINGLSNGPWLYKFVVDDVWQADPNSPAFIPSPQGGPNSLVILGQVNPDQIEQTNVAKGELKTQVLASQQLNQNSSFNIYTPPGYATSGLSYPVLYLLHGYGENENQWVNDGLITTFMDNLIAKGDIKPFILVMPSAGTSFYLEPYASLITTEIPAYLQNQGYRIKTGPQNTAVAGVSMGGFGAINLALYRSDLYGFAASLSGAFIDPFFSAYQENNPPKIPFSPVLYVGNIDQVDITGGFADSKYKTILAGNQALKALFTDKKQPFDYLTEFGGHDWHYWNRITPDMLYRVSEFFSAK